MAAMNNKIRLLRLWEMLLQESDADHPLSTNQILDNLLQLGLKCDRKTLYDDIELLKAEGYEILSRMEKHSKVYYVSDRKFSPPELKILMDAVQAAKFVTESKTQELVDKITALGGGYRAKLLKGNIVRFNTRKHTNESIYLNVDSLEAAIQRRKVVTFRYFIMNENGAREYKYDGRVYRVEPIALIYNDDNYYLRCYSLDHEDYRNYRVDRMDDVQMTGQKVSDKARLSEKEIAEYTSQVFRMYSGDIVDAVLEFDRSLIDVVFDKFGEGTQILRSADGRCVAMVKVQVSRTFWGWYFQFPDKMRIISPEGLMKQCREWAEICLKG